MEKQVRIIVIRIKEPTEGQIGILFHSEGCEGIPGLPAVSLSRQKGKCVFPVDRLHEHDNHTPWHPNAEKAAEYCNRVVDDIKQGLTVKGIPYEIVYAEAQLVKPSPAEIMKQAFAEGQAVWYPGAKLQKAPSDNVAKLVGHSLLVPESVFIMPIGTPYIPN